MIMMCEHACCLGWDEIDVCKDMWCHIRWMLGWCDMYTRWMLGDVMLDEY